MNDNTQLCVIFLIIIFGIMFIAHTMSDYDLVATTLQYCKPIDVKKVDEVK